MLSKILNRKFLLFILLVFSILFMTSNKVILFFSARHIAVLFLVAYYVSHLRARRNIDFIEKFFFVYIAVYLCCNLINGELFYSEFITSFITFHVTSIVLILSLPVLIYDKERFYMLLLALCIAYILNSLLTIAQFLNLPYSWDIGVFFNNGLARELDSNAEVMEAVDTLIGRTITAGLIGFVVTNGYFLATFLPITHRFLKQELGFAAGGITVVLACIAVFCCQERAAFACVIGYFLIYQFFYIKERPIMPILIAIVVVVLYNLVDFHSFDLGRFTDFKDDARTTITDNFFEYIMSDESIFGGLYHYLNIYKINQHNAILAAWTMGGIPCFILFTYWFVKATHSLIRKTLSSYSARHYLLSSLAISCLVYQVYSLTHSSGVQSDGVMFWFLYPLILQYERLFLNSRK